MNREIMMRLASMESNYVFEGYKYRVPACLTFDRRIALILSRTSSKLNGVREITRQRTACIGQDCTKTIRRN